MCVIKSFDHFFLVLKKGEKPIESSVLDAGYKPEAINQCQDHPPYLHATDW